MYKGIYSNKFDFFANSFMTSVSMGLSVYAIYLVGGTAMTQPLPPIVLMFFILAGVSAIVALYNGIKMIFAPKDRAIENMSRRKE